MSKTPSFKKRPRKLPVMRIPKHARRIVVWNEEGVGGWIYILVGYCPQTLPCFLGMLDDARSAFPDLDLNEVEFGRVTRSKWAEGFTALVAPITGAPREIPGCDLMAVATLDVAI